MSAIFFLKLALSVALYLVIFGIWGAMADCILKRRADLIEKILIGFFLYFAIFQIFAIPFILLKCSFHMLAILWIAVTAAVTGIALIIIPAFSKYRSEERKKISFRRMKPLDIVTAVVSMAVICCAFVLVIRQSYYGWDTGYYVGIMNEAVTTDTMYFMDGNSGRYVDALNFRYCLSSFFIQFTIPAWLMNARPLFAAFYIVRPLGFILSLFVAVLIARVVLGESGTKLMVFLTLYYLINILWLTNYTTSEFWLKRLYEAKGYCSNVVLPMAFYCFLEMYRKPAMQEAIWGEMFIIAFSSVAISMSALVTLPALIGIGSLVIFIFFKDRLYTAVNMLLCIMPNILYAVVFYLFNTGLIRIPIQ